MTSQFGLIGYPLGHSFSAEFFNEKFERENIDAKYDLFPITNISMLRDVLNIYNLNGLNVTIPYKEQVIPFLDEIDGEAEAIGAVNVIKILSDYKIKGFNTDIIGFRNSILPLLKPHMKKALLLGTGGASKAVNHVLKKLNIDVLRVSRHPSDFAVAYDSINKEIISTHHIIINTTPLGMWPHINEAPAIPYHYLTSSHLCFDLVYNPEITEFMKRAARYGATVKNGLDMLHGQAIAAWDIWQSDK